ncbi:hypothetical protein SLEP1_g17839 [Rubroshorea leprosula]|uniref:Uncharacterized protein n=1 Tax=Rubroshorea leprosula TaxID=152421 RepID=A0AAV5IVJ5_9ROSI|nr:hypothetical protein SLEP1_g17839 [Rubroshorea leprosula]
MSFPKKSIQDPFKPWKFFVFPTITIKPTYSFPFLLKLIIALFAFASIFCPLFYFAFPSRADGYFSCSHCDKSLRIFGHQKITIGDDVSGTPNYEKTNLSHIVFGISSSVEKWNNRCHYNELWWRPNITRGFVWLDKKPLENESWPETSPPYRISADTSRFKYTCSYGSRSALRIARIVKETFELGMDNVRWFVMGDDDTVFFLKNLVMVLQKYDHNQMYYIGANSESVEQDVIHSYTMAYGGGGFAISYPLAAELVTILDGCIDRYASSYGSDQKVDGCMREIGVTLTKELGFHQIDIRGNPYGLLAAHPLAPLVSLHHLDYVESIFPGMDQIDSLKRLINAYQVDPGRTLQRSFCYDLNRNWSVSVSWGYTVQLYPSLVTAKELDTTLLTFQTWRTWKNEPFVFNTRPMSQDPCQKPVLFFLESVENVGENRSLTRYRRNIEKVECNGPEYAPLLATEFLNVSASTLNPKIWKMAPRRQCCDVINGGKGDFQVKIRSCNPFESVTPP